MFEVFSLLRTGFGPNLRIRLRTSMDFGDFSEKSPRSKVHNFRATEPFKKVDTLGISTNSNLFISAEILSF